MKPLIVANWKCNPASGKEATNLFDLLVKELKGIRGAEIVICPPFIFLPEINSKAAEFKIGAQDCFWEQKGVYTGEISPAMLKDSDCQYVIIGHSERRTYFQESDEMVNRKLKAVLKVGLNPILCIGETKGQRDQGQAETILEKQIISALRDISESDFSKVVIAYEPVWAIGTGNPCSVDEAQKMGSAIREIVANIYNAAVFKKVQILYGGSVNSKNAAGYVKEAGLQGLLVGGASLDAKEFAQIVKNVIA